MGQCGDHPLFQASTSPSNRYFVHPFLQIILVENSQCGKEMIQFRSPSSSDDLCLRFCMYPSSMILPIPQKYFIIILCAGGIRSSCRAACSRGSAGPLWPPPWLPSYRTISTTGAAREQPAGGSPPQVTESTEYTWTITGHREHGIHMDQHM